MPAAALSDEAEGIGDAKPPGILFPFPKNLTNFVRNSIAMPILISDDIIRQSSLTEKEFKIEMAIVLYEAGLLNFGKAKELSGLDVLAFLELLGQRKIEAPYSEEDFENDLRLSRQIRL